MTRREFAAVMSAATVEVRAADREWWLKPVRMFHPNMREVDVRGMDVRKFMEDCAATNADSVVVSAGGIYAFYPSKVPYHYVSPLLEGKDFLKEAVEHGHRLGMKVIARVDFSKARENVWKDHPDWFSKRADGTWARSGKFYQTCANSPYATEEFAEKVVREILGRYEVDGFHLNAGGFPGYCHCDWCRRKFREKYEQDLPGKADWGSADWRRFLTWRYDTSAANFAFLHRVMLDAREGVFWTGELAGLDDPGWVRNRAFDIVRMSRSMSSLMSTIDNLAPGLDMRWMAAGTAAFARNAGARAPIINLKAHIRDGGWPRASVPAPEYEMNAWQALASGAGLKTPIFGVPAKQEDGRNIEVIQRVFGVMKKHAWVYEGVEAVAPVALLWSHQTLESYGLDNPKGRYAENFYGFHAAMMEGHVPCTVVGEPQLTIEQLRRFRVLVLPNAACVSDAQARAIRDFVREGGGLVASARTSLYDENGLARKSFALEDAFGARVDPAATPLSRANAYLCAAARHELTAGMEKTTILPVGFELLPVETFAGALAPLVYGWHHDPGIPEEVDSPVPSKLPGFVVNSFGKGRAVYFAAELDKFYFQRRMADHRRLFRAAVEWAGGMESVVRTNAPAGVGITLWRKPGWLFVHLVNTVGRSPMDELTPVSDIEVSIGIPGPVKVTEARALIGRGKAGWRLDGARVQVVLERLGAYEVVAIRADGLA